MILQRFIRDFFRLFFIILLTRRKIAGLANIPKSGPYLVISNHISHLDLLVVVAAAPVIKNRFLISERWVNSWWMGPVLNYLGAIPITWDEHKNNYRSIRNGLRTLKEGTVMSLAPEGTISPEGLLQANKGAGWFASRADVPILPISITNTDLVRKNAKKLRRTTVELKIGDPFKLPKWEFENHKGELDAYRELYMAKLASMLPTHYHGQYAESPALKAILEGKDPWPIILEQHRINLKEPFVQ